MSSAASWSAKSSTLTNPLPSRVGAMADGGPSRNSAVRGSGSRLGVAVVRHAETWRTARVTDAMLARAARAGLEAAAPARPGTCEVSILLTDDAEMRALHLLGFDNMEEGEAERMETLEKRALASLGIADPYAERREVRTTEVSP